MHNADVLHNALLTATMMMRKGRAFKIVRYSPKQETVYYRPFFANDLTDIRTDELDHLCDDDSIQLFTTTQLETQ